MDSNLISLDLSISSKETLELFMNETSGDSIFGEILDANRSRPEVLKLLYEHPDTPEETRASAASMLSLPLPSTAEVEEIKKKTHEEKEKEPAEMRNERLVLKIQRLSVSEKIRMGMRGNSEIRGILLRDSNKLVILSVLDNPKITDSEIEAVARNRSALEEALRTIANNKEWTKNYAIQLALVTNPKTPPGLAMKFVPGLKKRDLSLLEKNKNVSEAVRTTAKKIIKIRQKD